MNVAFHLSGLRDKVNHWREYPYRVLVNALRESGEEIERLRQRVRELEREVNYWKFDGR